MIRPINIAAIQAQRGDVTSPTERDITSAQTPQPRSVDYNTSFDELNLPDSVTATLDDGTLVTLPVSWGQGPYDEIIPDTYVLPGTLLLPSGITNSTGVIAEISITVRDPLLVDVWVKTGGDDDDGDGSEDNAFLTIQKGIDVAEALGGPRIVRLGPGTFPLTEYLIMPTNIGLVGDGVNNTFIEGDASLDYSADVSLSQWGLDKFLIQATNLAQIDSSVTLRAFTINGISKHGGIYINNLNNVFVSEVSLDGFNFTGLYYKNTDQLELENVTVTDSGLSNISMTTGALMMGSNTNTIINGLVINEDEGRGIKVFGPPGTDPTITNLRYDDCSFSVTPDVSYDGAALNMAIEMSGAFMSGVEMTNCRLDGGFLFRTHANQTASYNSNARTLFMRNDCRFDLDIRANGKGFSLQADAHNIEVSDTYFYKGGDAIFSANPADVGSPAKNNWLIYNCRFRDQQTLLSSGIIKSSYVALANVRFFNNTVHIINNNPVFIFHTENGLISNNVTIRNNAILDESTADGSVAQGGPNALVKLDGGGGIANLVVTHNSIFGMPVGSIPSATYANNLTSNPQLTKSGLLPDPYYRPLPSSPLIYAGINVGLPFVGSAPTIGSYEPLSVAQQPIASVASIDDILVPTGTLFANIGLPATVSATLDNGNTSTFAVTWAQGGYNAAVEDIYPLVGTLTLPTGVTNPESLTAAVNVIVGDAIIVFSDTFDRTDTTPGADYTTQGTMTYALNGASMQIDGADGQLDQRILATESIVGLNNMRIIMTIEVAEYGPTTWGLGIGIQNAVNPDPNRAVLLNFWMNSVTTPGRAEILSGNNTTNNTGFTFRAASTTQQPMALSNVYTMILERELQGSDLLWTGTITNLATLFTNTVTWLEVGSGSLLYEGTSKVTIYRFGGLQQINSLVIQDLQTENPFPNVVSVQSVTPLSVANGVVFGTNGATVGLPQTRTVTLSDASTPSYAVVWNQGTYAPTTAGVYNVTGTITLPPSVTNTNNVTVSAQITIAAPGPAATFNWYVDSLSGDDNAAGTIGAPFATGVKASTVALPGQSIAFRGSSDPTNPREYRETIIPTNSGTASGRITYAAYPGEYARISGLNVIPNTGWTNDGGEVYKKTITQPVNGYQVPSSFTHNMPVNNLMSNTSILHNQVFRNGDMMIEARWPKIDHIDDLFTLNTTNYRHYSQASNKWSSTTELRDASLPSAADDYYNGARLINVGWFWAHQRIVTNYVNATRALTHGAINDSDDGGVPVNKYRHWWYITGKRALLTNEREWHWESNILYLYQPGGGTISGTVEYKARNWGFDLRGKSYITITGLYFKGCEVATGNDSTNWVIVDNVRATYTNHVQFYPDNFPGYGIATITGLKLLGTNNIVKNSEFKYTASHGLWLGNNGLAQNNLYSHCAYDMSWGSPMSVWGETDNQKFLYNTVHTVGRTCLDLGFSYYGGKGAVFGHNNNIEIANNNFYDFIKLNVDGGAIYGWGFRDTQYLQIHHNYFHHSGAVPDPSGAKLHGGQRALYFDQASGQGIIHTNLFFKNHENINQDCADMYNQMNYELKPGYASKIYNNTFASAGGDNISYTTYQASPSDIKRNNIFRCRINRSWGNGNPGLNEQYNVFCGDNVTRTSSQNSAGTSFLHATSVRNAGLQWAVAGDNVSDYYLLASTEARGRATALPEIGIVAGDDCGCFQYGETPWVAGYVAVPYHTEAPVDPGTVDIDSIDTVVNDFPVAYNTAFGSNGVTVGLPQTIDVTYDDASTGTLDVTWTGTYSATASPWDDIIYTLTGTPDLTGDITNSGNLTLSVDITRRSIIFPVTGSVKRVSDPSGLVNNTTNAYGIVASNIATQVDSFKGTTTTDFVQSGTGPTLTAGQLVFTGTQKMQQTVNNTEFEFFHYKADPANYKFIVFKVLTITDTNDLAFIMGNNGYFEGNSGIAIGSQTSSTNASINIKVTDGNNNNALMASHAAAFTPGTKFLLTVRIDNTLLPSAGKSRVYNNTTLISATSTGTGVFSNAEAPSDPMEIGNAGAAAGYNFEGSMGAELWIDGGESDAVVLKIQQDIMALAGIS